MRVYLPCGCKGILHQLSEGYYQLAKFQVHRSSCKLDPLQRIMEMANAPYRPIVKQDPCVYCGGKGGTVDHIIPQSEGGHGGWDNLAGACVECNSRKGSKGLLLFLVERFNGSRPKPRTLPNN